MAEKRRDSYFQTFFWAALPQSDETLANRFGNYDEDPETQEGSANRNAKQMLLRTMVTETLLQRHLHVKLLLFKRTYDGLALRFHTVPCMPF